MGKAELINNKGMIELESRRFSHALELFDKAIEIDKNYSFPWGNRAIALFHLDKPDEALKSVDHAILLDPSNSKFWNTKGGILVRKDQLTEAEKCLRTAIEIQPDNDEAWRNLGEVYRLKRQWDLANDSFDHALSLNPKNATGWIGKGQIAYVVGNLDKALEHIDKALRIDNLNPIAWNEKGCALVKKGDLLGAEQSFKASLRSDPDFGDALSNMGEISRRLGKTAEAEKYLNEAIIKQPNNANNWNNKGALLSGLGNLTEALTCFDKALEINPGHLDALSNKIGVLGATGRFDEAEALLQNVSIDEDWDAFQSPTLYIPRESTAKYVPERARRGLSEFYAEILKSTMIALRSFQASKPAYVQEFIQNQGQGSIKETDFRDDFKRLMEMRFENSVAECKYGDGLADVRIQKVGSQLESMIFEFKIWGRNDYQDVVMQTMKYVTSFENCAVIVMINPNRKSLAKEYPEKVILSQNTYIGESLISKPLLSNSNLEHFSSEHMTETGKTIKIFHFIFEIFQ